MNNLYETVASVAEILVTKVTVIRENLKKTWVRFQAINNKHAYRWLPISLSLKPMKSNSDVNISI